MLWFPHCGSSISIGVTNILSSQSVLLGKIESRKEICRIGKATLILLDEPSIPSYTVSDTSAENTLDCLKVGWREWTIRLQYAGLRGAKLAIWKLGIGIFWK